MAFAVGQQVVWRYRPQNPCGPLTLVDAEVIQDGTRRVRIRIETPCNTVLLRWVHPKNLRPKRAGEPAYPYPAHRETAKYIAFYLG